MWTNRFMENFRTWRSKHFAVLGKFFVKLHISANLLTTFALLTGLACVYFLFENYWLFLIFGLLHIFLDSMDGVVARLTKPSRFGHFYDILTDRTIEVLLLAKIGYALTDYYAYLVVGLVVLAQLFYFASREQAPILFTRTLVFIVLTFYPLLSFAPIIAYLSSGVAAVYTLARQLQWATARRN